MTIAILRERGKYFLVYTLAIIATEELIMHAIKLLYMTGLSLVIFPAVAGTFVCSSSNNSYHHCDLPNAEQRDIHIQRVTQGNCDSNTAWGIDDAGIWVDKGCSAVFEYASNDENGPDVVVQPEVVDPYYAPGFYGAAGYYDADYEDCNNHDCNNNHQNNNNNEQNNQRYNNAEDRSEANDAREEGGFHGGGGGRR